MLVITPLQMQGKHTPKQSALIHTMIALAAQSAKDPASSVLHHIVCCWWHQRLDFLLSLSRREDLLLELGDLPANTQTSAFRR